MKRDTRLKIALEINQTVFKNIYKTVIMNKSLLKYIYTNIN